MAKNYKILIIAVLTVLVAAGGWWFWRQSGLSGQKEKILFNTGFSLLDDEKNLIWNGAAELDAETSGRFAGKVSEITADLAAAANDRERLLADYNNLALYQKYLGDYRAAYDAYLESLRLESRARVTWQNFADVLYKMGALKSAEAAFKKAIELNKYVPESYVKLADYYKAVGDDVKVEETYKLAVETIKESYESDTLVLSAHANWLADKKRYVEAVKILEQLMAKQPENKAAIEARIEELKNY